MLVPNKDFDAICHVMIGYGSQPPPPPNRAIILKNKETSETWKEALLNPNRRVHTGRHEKSTTGDQFRSVTARNVSIYDSLMHTGIYCRFKSG